MAGRGAMDSVCLVVPCFDEERRLRPDQLCALGSDERVSLVLVDDGSADRTLDLLHTIASQVARATVLGIEPNGGKGEAVRAGLIASRTTQSAWVGYVDADMSTPPAEVHRLIDLATTSVDVEVLLGSRLALLGRDIRRSPFRHYTGRAFATLASQVLSKAVYDTQCGTKLFRRTEAFERCIERPFRSRWAFDVELLGRLDSAGVEPATFWEEPLRTWHDVDRSRRSLTASVRASAELLPIWWDLRSERR